MTGRNEIVIGGVDTHKDMHWVAAIFGSGQRIASRQFCADTKGYKETLIWLQGHGELSRIGIEGTGSYGAGLCRYLKDKGIEVLEVTAPDKALRRLKGKTDAEDAFQAAEATLSCTRCVSAKDRSSDIEGLRSLRVAYEGAVKARTAALNSLDALVINADESIKTGLEGMKSISRARTCAAWRISKGKAVTKRAMDKCAIRSIAKRVLELDGEAKELDLIIEGICKSLVPKTMELKGVGHHSASKLLLAAGANIERMGSEAHFSMLCGASPISASSGKNNRMRLNRGGDRQANSALYTAVLSRMACDEKTRDYVLRKLSEGKSKRDAIRCLKRYVAREVYGYLKADLLASGLGISASADTQDTLREAA